MGPRDYDRTAWRSSGPLFHPRALLALGELGRRRGGLLPSLAPQQVANGRTDRELEIVKSSQVKSSQVVGGYATAWRSYATTFGIILASQFDLTPCCLFE